MTIDLIPAIAITLTCVGIAYHIGALRSAMKGAGK